MTAQRPLEVTRIALTDLGHDPANPRLHDARNITTIQNSLREHGQVEPLVVQAGTMMVIGGNGRMDAMTALGWTEADCVVLDVDDTQARRMAIALNRSGELAEWDFGVLAKHLDALGADDDFDPGDLGFSDDEYMRLLADFAVNEAGQEGDDSGAESSPDATLPAGTQPAHLPSSDVRMIQLFFNDETEPLVRVWAKRLAEEYGTDNLTDTVYECMRRVARGRGWLEDGSNDTE
jgi:ParB-like chromosome segregation protein Spo0J